MLKLLFALNFSMIFKNRAFRIKHVFQRAFIKVKVFDVDLMVLNILVGLFKQNNVLSTVVLK